MCPECYSSGAATGVSNGSRSAAEELHDEPISQHHPGRQPRHEDEEPGQHASARIKQKVGTHHPGDGAARAYTRNLGIPVKENMCRAGDDSARQIKQKIAKVSEI